MSASAPAVDPRMKARRIAVMRSEGRRRLRVLTVAVGLAAVAAGAWGLSRTPLFDVDRITVTGTAGANRGEILENSTVAVGAPMLMLDVDGAEQSIESLPWVKSAHVWRDWPATVRIAVEQRVPAAAVPAGEGRTALVDANGYAVAFDSGETALPFVSVPFSGELGDIHTAADGPLAFVTAMPEDLRGWVTAVNGAVDADGIGLTLVGGATVVLGEPVLIDDKIGAVRAVLGSADLRCITAIDVTMPDLATVTRATDPNLGPETCRSLNAAAQPLG